MASPTIFKKGEISIISGLNRPVTRKIIYQDIMFFLLSIKELQLTIPALSAIRIKTKPFFKYSEMAK